MNVNDIFKTSDGELVITSLKGKDASYRFLKSGYEGVTRKSHIINGTVKDRFKRTCFGIGYIGGTRYKSTKDKNAYQVWRDMIKRCYYEQFHKIQPNYRDCFVCDEWHNFQTFADWYYKNYPSEKEHGEMQLDKDIVVDGNKEYSPSKCAFVTPRENSVKANAKSYSFLSPSGSVIDVYNLMDFCRENNLNRVCMIRTLQGKQSSHKGYRKTD